MAFNIQEIRADLASVINQHPEALQAALSSNRIFLSKYAERLTKVNGEYPSIISLMGHVVQAYADKFTPFDSVIYKKKNLKTFRQKVDFLITPSQILSTVYAHKFDEGKKPDEKTISKETMDMVLEKIISDLDYLSINGEFNPAKVGITIPEFGYSMDGLNKVLANQIKDTTNPVYFIPGDAITSNNILAQVTKFEKNLPSLAKPRIKYIFTSLEDAEEYQEAFDDQFGARPSFKDKDALKSRFGQREIVGIPGLKKGTLFATIDKNLVELVDVVENPAHFTDVQVQDRQVKLLSEFSLGYDFAVNEYLYVHTSAGDKNLGLNNPDLNKLFYPNESKLS